MQIDNLIASQPAVEQKNVEVTIVDRDRFLKMIETAADFTAKTDNVPVLQNIFFQIKKEVPKRTAEGMVKVPGNALFLIANDGTHTIAQGIATEEGQSSVIEATGELETMLPKAFADLVAKLPAKQSLKLEFSNDRLNIQSGRSSYELVLTATEQFPQPKPEQAKPFVISSKEFCAALKNAITFVDPKNSGALQGVHIMGTPKGLLIESCDRTQGYRELLQGAAENVDITIVKDTVNRICSTFDKKDTKIAVVVGESSLTINGDGKSLICSFLDAKYPDLSKMTFEEFAANAVVDTKEMIEMLSRTLLYQSAKGASTNPAIVSLKNGVLLVNVSSAIGKSEEAVELSDSSGEIRLGLDASKMISALKCFTDYEKTTIRFKSPLEVLSLQPVGGNDELHKTAFMLPVRVSQGV